MDKKIGPSSRIEALESIKENNKGNDANTQAKRLHKALQTVGPITTIEARRYLDILAPAARIFELRYRQNLEIVSTWQYDFSDAGVKHRIGRYTLVNQASNDESIGVATETSLIPPEIKSNCTGGGENAES